ncbi:MFS transporter [Sphingomonas sp. SUN039]|uniref:MFS transporter n=1 Tax=Sphingomonas sp. SUN039 TaxID=2937787 RepID=UPI002164A4CC|nr:MFS transporter [Sphingomonas sp. SUN039]UVO54579.1 MFS transporter [Sphingomonas sp. SUN039]
MTEQAIGRERAAWKSIAIVASGNFLEMYDFMVFGFYAAIISKVFFASGDAYGALMLTLMTFGAGFLMRPVGALLLGSYLDRKGRRVGLLVALSMMAVGTFLIAVTPGYAAIGLAAPLLVLFGRLVQGLSAGVELGGVSVYLAEIAKPGRKGFYVAWQSASQQVAVIFAAALGYLLTSILSPAEMQNWGWRVPFLVGCAIIPLLLFMRSKLQETPEFEALPHQPTFGEVMAGVRSAWSRVLLGMMLVVMTTVSFYLITNYTPTFGTRELKLSDESAFLVTLCVGLTNFIVLPVMGGVSDRIGRKPLLIGATVLALLTAYPAMTWLVSAPSFERLLIVELWLAVLYASYNGAMIVFLTEVMPQRIRTTSFSLAYSLATTLGGFTPAICTYLIHVTDNKAAPGLWLSVAAVAGLVATLLLTRLHRSSARADDLRMPAPSTL